MVRSWRRGNLCPLNALVEKPHVAAHCFLFAVGSSSESRTPMAALAKGDAGAPPGASTTLSSARTSSSFRVPMTRRV